MTCPRRQVLIEWVFFCIIFLNIHLFFYNQIYVFSSNVCSQPNSCSSSDSCLFGYNLCILPRICAYYDEIWNGPEPPQNAPFLFVVGFCISSNDRTSASQKIIANSSKPQKRQIGIVSERAGRRMQIFCYNLQSKT